MKMQAAIQPYIDAAISKTVNVPEDYPFEDFESLYLEAWRAGLKGITTYRPNSVLGSILSVDQAPQDLDQSEPDRRIRIADAPTVALAALRWPHRPRLTDGSPSWTYMVEAPANRFAVFVGHVENGAKQPFEVWVNGEQTPRGLAALAKNLSMDMRAQDRAWLQLKLESLEKTPGAPFSVAMPPDGRTVPVAGAVSAFAKVVQYRCAALGVFDGPDGGTPLVDAMFSRKEPKSGVDGTLSWTVDILNPDHRRRLRHVRQGMRAARRHQATVLGLAVGCLPDRVQRPDQVAEPRHAGDRPGLDRQEAPRAEGPARGPGRLLRPCRPAPRSRRCSPRPSPTSPGC